MATRTPHTGVAGEVLTAANLAKYPKGWIAQEAEAGPVVVNTSDDVLVSIAVTVGASRMIRVYAQGTVTDGDNNSADGVFWIEEDGVDIGRVHRHPDADEKSYIGAAAFSDGPSAGSHTYRIVGNTTSGDMSVTGITITVEDVGPSSS